MSCVQIRMFRDVSVQFAGSSGLRVECSMTHHPDIGGAGRDPCTVRGNIKGLGYGKPFWPWNLKIGFYSYSSTPRLWCLHAAGQPLPHYA
jgi:hypothetical protein